MSDWQNRIVRSGEERPDQLLANPANWRIHPRDQQGILEGALEEIGWIAPVIVNVNSGYIVDGHLRVLLALRNNQTVPVDYVDLTDNEEAIALASLDMITNLANQDDQLWRALIEQLAFDDHNLQEWAANLLGPTADEAPKDDQDEPDVNVGVQWGVFIPCEGEDAQAALYEDLTEEGYEVRVVNT